ncbi:hypothetical protein AMAG_04042 [Allomyces macrogynus ATCC 38327]|uniref:AAA+ ATPase domain-containing protein n=1 Tax=Allomyces macrogynus (strain ATCC 38327) TaxID=578462 RepID=A0A0L0S7S8_ALLM3|nr:hypothetical protein AMAG_04042 [Allomyces macrogynus ATCC 38327]|eukprot:KNE58471.1 hypothetical protein AMAG_04042 [Allomyces macrogynus ATCC 38327]
MAFLGARVPDVPVWDPKDEEDDILAVDVVTVTAPASPDIAPRATAVAASWDSLRTSTTDGTDTLEPPAPTATDNGSVPMDADVMLPPPAPAPPVRPRRTSTRAAKRPSDAPVHLFFTRRAAASTAVSDGDAGREQKVDVISVELEEPPPKRQATRASKAASKRAKTGASTTKSSGPTTRSTAAAAAKLGASTKSKPAATSANTAPDSHSSVDITTVDTDDDYFTGPRPPTRHPPAHRFPRLPQAAARGTLAAIYDRDELLDDAEALVRHIARDARQEADRSNAAMRKFFGPVAGQSLHPFFQKRSQPTETIVVDGDSDVEVVTTTGPRKKWPRRDAAMPTRDQVHVGRLEDEMDASSPPSYARFPCRITVPKADPLPPLPPLPAPDPGANAVPLLFSAEDDELFEELAASSVPDPPVPPPGLDANMWCVKYAPQRATDVLGNAHVAATLVSWLTARALEKKAPVNAFTKLKQGKKPSAADSDDFVVHDHSGDESDYMDSSDDDDDEVDGDDAPRRRRRRHRGTASRHGLRFRKSGIVVIEGPTGCGKSALVYAAAAETGCAVFEVNPGTKRGGKDLETLVGDMMQNHTLTMPGGSAAGSGNVAQSLLLLDEADILFDEDKTMWAGVQALAARTKRPIVVTCATADDLPLTTIPLAKILTVDAPARGMVVQYLQAVVHAEGQCWARETIDALLPANMDFRGAIMATQWTAICRRHAVPADLLRPASSFSTYFHLDTNTNDADDLDAQLVQLDLAVSWDAIRLPLSEAWSTTEPETMVAPHPDALLDPAGSIPVPHTAVATPWQPALTRLDSMRPQVAGFDGDEVDPYLFAVEDCLVRELRMAPISPGRARAQVWMDVVDMVAVMARYDLGVLDATANAPGRKTRRRYVKTHFEANRGTLQQLVAGTVGPASDDE